MPVLLQTALRALVSSTASIWWDKQQNKHLLAPKATQRFLNLYLTPNCRTLAVNPTTDSDTWNIQVLRTVSTLQSGTHHTSWVTLALLAKHKGTLPNQCDYHGGAVTTRFSYYFMVLIIIIQCKYKSWTKLNKKHGSIGATHEIRNVWVFLWLIFHSIQVVMKGRAKGQDSWPQSVMTIFLEGFPLLEPKLSIFFTTSIPSFTCPNTTCFPSSQSVFAVQMKNWDPFVLGPALAIERTPGPTCLSMKFSSGNLLP